MKHPFLVAVALSAVLGAAAGAAQAQGYLGAVVGATNANLDCTGTTTCDNNGTGGKVFGGYRLPSGLGIEGTYINFGKASATFPVGATPVSASLRSHSVGAGVSYLLPFAPSAWSATVRLGVASNKAKASFDGGGVSASLDEGNTALYGGVQLSWRPSQNVSVDFSSDFSRFELAGDHYNARLLGVGLTFTF